MKRPKTSGCLFPLNLPDIWIILVIMSNNEDDDGYSTSSSEEDINIHLMAREGTIEDIDWALFKDRNRLLNLKELKTGYSCLHCA